MRAGPSGLGAPQLLLRYVMLMTQQNFRYVN